MNFIGTDTQYLTANGLRKKRVHLDGAASPLSCTTALDAIQTLLPHYSNTHSYVHSSAQISTQALTWAHDTVLQYLGANKRDYTAIFIGSGTTAASNRLARGLARSRKNKKVVLISSMEHHANDLPHRQFENNVIHIPLQEASVGESNNASTSHSGAIDLTLFEKLCETHSGNINYVAVSSVSNVTGISNPIEKMSEIAHKHGALILVDGAQSVAHKASHIEKSNIDFMVFSGHKVYCPMAPGVLIGKRSALRKLNEQDLGGGSVSTVSYYDHQLLDNYPSREQSGTPNIVGAIALAKVLEQLNKLGFEKIESHALTLSKQLIEGLGKIKKVRIYGDLKEPRIGAIAFNHEDIDHGLFAAILNDYFAIAVRNECFCAHPYVSDLLKEQLWQLDLSDIDEDQQESFINLKRGMVRASISLYTKASDIDYLLQSMTEIIDNIEQYKTHYSPQADGSYRHDSFQVDWKDELGWS